MNAIEEQARLLGEMLSEHEKKLREAVVIFNREEAIVSNLRRTIAALMGENEPSSVVDTGTEARIVMPTDTPSRKGEYANLTIVASAQRALSRLVPPNGFAHVDQIVQEVYDPIPHKDVFYRIKRTVVSELIRGMDKGLFRRGDRPNSFGLPAVSKRTETNHARIAEES